MKLSPQSLFHRRPPGDRRLPTTRSDIQGLRALAVALVISTHLFDAPVGGFVGVDVFFVLSGFLITQLLLREHGREGRISYLDFYRRRIRRIVPVATLVLGVTIAATYLLFNDVRGHQTAIDGAWAFGFLANWRFADLGTDYFASGGAQSPLQHYWSLAVEEQFYVVWPTLLVLALAVCGRLTSTPRRRQAVLAAIVAVLALASFGYSLAHSTAAPVAAYFSTFDRAWELLVGAAIAVTAPAWARLPSTLRPLLAYAGLAGIVASALLIRDDVAFPAPWGALPVLGTALVVTAGIGAEPRFFGVLRNPVTNYLGDISYSLYLWHFPVVVLLLAYFPDGGAAYQAIGLGLIASLSALTFHLVENPVRHSQWLEPRWRRILHNGPVNHGHRLANTWLAVGTLVTVLLTTMAITSQAAQDTPEDLLGAVPSGQAQGATQKATGADGATEGPAVAYLQKRLSQSLQLTRFPVLTPSADSLSIKSWLAQMDSYACSAVTPENVSDCSFGDVSDTTTVVLGDSTALAYVPAVREAVESISTVQQLTLPECPPFDAPTDRLKGGAFPECLAFRPWALDEIDRIEPGLVIMSSSALYPYGAMTSGATGAKGLAEVRAGFRDTLAELSAPDRVLVIVSPPPGAGDPSECVTKVGSPDDCEQEIPPEWFEFTDMEREVAEASGAYYLDTRDWLCVDDYCPGIVGSTPAYVDGVHLSLEFSKQLGPAMFEGLGAIAKEARAARKKGSDADRQPASDPGAGSGS